jgi:hypothetical protein
VEPLYRRMLGADIERLPPGLRRFHLAPEGGRGEGLLRVTRGSGLLHRLLGALAGFPAAGEQIRVRLQVAIEGGRERWVRHFDERPLESVQWAEGTLCAERSGLATFLFRLDASERGLVYHFVRVRMLGVPLPSFLGPTSAVELTRTDDPDEWRVDVRFRFPILGDVLRYQGVIRAA